MWILLLFLSFRLVVVVAVGCPVFVEELHQSACQLLMLGESPVRPARAAPSQVVAKILLHQFAVRRPGRSGFGQLEGVVQQEGPADVLPLVVHRVRRRTEALVVGLALDEIALPVRIVVPDVPGHAEVGWIVGGVNAPAHPLVLDGQAVLAHGHPDLLAVAADGRRDLPVVGRCIHCEAVALARVQVHLRVAGDGHSLCHPAGEGRGTLVDEKEGV